MTDLILAGSAILLACDTAESDGAGGYKAIVGGKIDGTYPTTCGVTGAALGVALPADFVPGRYGYANGAFTRIPDNPAAVQATIAAKLAALADYRYQREIAGTTFARDDGLVFAIATDRDSQGKMQAEYQAASDGTRADGEVWKCGQVNADKSITVDFYAMTNAEIKALVLRGRQYVKGCFGNEDTHMKAIKALTTIDDANAYDFSTGWPA